MRAGLSCQSGSAPREPRASCGWQTGRQSYEHDALDDARSGQTTLTSIGRGFNKGARYDRVFSRPLRPVGGGGGRPTGRGIGGGGRDSLPIGWPPPTGTSSPRRRAPALRPARPLRGPLFRLLCGGPAPGFAHVKKHTRPVLAHLPTGQQRCKRLQKSAPPSSSARAPFVQFRRRPATGTPMEAR